MASAEQVRTLVRASWQRSADGCTPVEGGMNSSAWLVTVAGERFVAKAVPAAQQVPFEAGLIAASRVQQAGIDAGAPVRAVDGALTVPLDDAVVALLRYVPGRPLDPRDPVDQRCWGDTLGAMHRALAGHSVPGLTRFHWVRPQARHLSVEPWVRPAVGSAVAAVSTLCVSEVLSRGVVHGDPAPEAFRFDPATGRTGLIDWGAAVSGPLVYDVASAVMYAGGRRLAGELLEAYLAAGGPVSGTELDAALPIMLRFRFAVQADYFAYRLSVDDRTGIRGAEENLAGLHHAREMTAELAVECSDS